jgi:serine/threonine protein kinase
VHFLAANVLIHEDGRLQLCDFGVATVMETKLDKRRTFIGTLHWMPPEMWDQKPEYSDEVRYCCHARRNFFLRI